GLLGIDIWGTFDDVLFAYQRAEDKDMRCFCGDFLPLEECTCSGTTAYSFDAAQDLRRSRHNAVGYQTAMFTGDMASFRPFLPFEDFDILDPVGWEDKIEDKIFTERRSEEHTSELQSRFDLVCRLLLEKKNHTN